MVSGNFLPTNCCLDLRSNKKHAARLGDPAAPRVASTASSEEGGGPEGWIELGCMSKGIHMYIYICLCIKPCIYIYLYMFVVFFVGVVLFWKPGIKVETFKINTCLSSKEMNGIYKIKTVSLPFPAHRLNGFSRLNRLIDMILHNMHRLSHPTTATWRIN